MYENLFGDIFNSWMRVAQWTSYSDSWLLTWSISRSVGFVVNFRACAVSEFQIQLVGKTREHLLFTAHQEILIQYVENNLTII